jgi:hypothetical protein
MRTIDDYTKIDNVVFDGIDEEDFPDYCDAFILSADYDGEPMTEEEIESLDEEYVREQLMNKLF